MKNLNLGVRGNINQKAFEFQLLLDWSFSFRWSDPNLKRGIVLIWGWKWCMNEFKCPVKHKFTRTPENARVCGNIWRCSVESGLFRRDVDTTFSTKF
jgi:hypothetical protein